MDYSQYCVLLLLVSLALLVLEVFVPSGGFISLLMLGALVGSILCAYLAWWETSRGLWWGYLGVVLILMPTALIAAFAIFPRTRYGRRVLLDAPTSEEVTPYAKEQHELQNLLGKKARAMTPHRPSGMIELDGQRYHAETRGMMLEVGDIVEVTAVRGNRLVVRLSDESPSQTPKKDHETGPEQGPQQARPTSKQHPRRRDTDSVDPFLGDNETS